MKKFVLLWSWILMSLCLTACSWNKSTDTDLTSANFESETCNQYFQLVNCIIDNDPDEIYTPEVRQDLKATLKETQDSRLEKDPEEAASLCASSLAKFNWMDDELTEIWCTMN